MISIIMPTYNRGYMIEKAINSIKRQTYKKYELIIVDDCSTDNTFQIVKKCLETNIKYYCLKENKGANFARNYGIRKSKGDFLAFLDSDNEWDELFLESRMQRITSQKVDLVFGRVMKFEEDTNYIWPQNLSEEISIKENILKVMFFGNVIDTNTVLMKKEFYYRAGEFDETLKRFQDWDFFFRVLCIQELKVYFADDVLVKSQMQANSISQQTNLYWASRLHIFKKYIHLCREKGYLYDVVYYLINLSGEYVVSDEIEKEILNTLDKEDFVGIFTRLKEMNDYIQNIIEEQKTNFCKNDVIMELLQEWLKKSKNGWTIEKQLLIHRIQRVIIYGFGVLGKTLYNMLKNTMIDVICIIDKDLNKLQGVKEKRVLTDFERIGDIKQVDAVIVTPVFDFDGIEGTLRKYTKAPVLFIKNIIEGDCVYNNHQNPI